MEMMEVGIEKMRKGRTGYDGGMEWMKEVAEGVKEEQGKEEQVIRKIMEGRWCLEQILDGDDGEKSEVSERTEWSEVSLWGREVETKGMDTYFKWLLPRKGERASLVPGGMAKGLSKMWY